MWAAPHCPTSARIGKFHGFDHYPPSQDLTWHARSFCLARRLQEKEWNIWNRTDKQTNSKKGRDNLCLCNMPKRLQDVSSVWGGSRKIHHLPDSRPIWPGDARVAGCHWSRFSEQGWSTNGSSTDPFWVVASDPPSDTRHTTWTCQKVMCHDPKIQRRFIIILNIQLAIGDTYSNSYMLWYTSSFY